jgi:hypothetical protein
MTAGDILVMLARGSLCVLCVPVAALWYRRSFRCFKVKSVLTLLTGVVVRVSSAACRP